MTDEIEMKSDTSQTRSEAAIEKKPEVEEKPEVDEKSDAEAEKEILLNKNDDTDKTSESSVKILSKDNPLNKDLEEADIPEKNIDDEDEAIPFYKSLWFIILMSVLGATALGLIIWGIVVACSSADETPEGVPPLPEAPSNPGWGDFAAWSQCSATCGAGQISRMRLCTPKLEENGFKNFTVCDGYPQESIEVEQCLVEQCKEGRDIVKETAKNLRNYGIQDNLFLDRYAESVTRNGREIPANMTGIWAVKNEDINQLLEMSSVASRKRRATSKPLTTDVIANIQEFCAEIKPEDMEWSDFIFNQSETNPCVSAIVFLTLIRVKNKYPVPATSSEQEKLLNAVTDVFAVSWDTVMDIELEELQYQCSQTDIDYEFVIDSSGSIGAANWQQTMNLISQVWIQDAIRPKGSQQCGHHVAGRKFSACDASSQVLFYNFLPPSPSAYSSYGSYAKYVGKQFEREPFKAGGTCTHEALRRVRQYDLRGGRAGTDKFVMVFTDGASQDPSRTASEARALQNSANVFAFGIGSGIQQSELNSIASKPENVGQMQNFDQIEDFLRQFMLRQDGCKPAASNVYPFRAINLKQMKTVGLSYLTAAEQGAEIESCISADSVSCGEFETTRNFQTCSKCSFDIAAGHLPKIAAYKQNLVLASNAECFDAAIIGAIASRLTTFGEELGDDGWMPCKNDQTLRCYGILHVPEISNPIISGGVAGIQYLQQTIKTLSALVQEVSGIYPTLSEIDKTRSGIAAFVSGVYQTGMVNIIDYWTINNDFSGDVLARAKYFSENNVL